MQEYYIFLSYRGHQNSDLENRPSVDGVKYGVSKHLDLACRPTEVTISKTGTGASKQEARSMAARRTLDSLQKGEGSQ